MSHALACQASDYLAGPFARAPAVDPSSVPRLTILSMASCTRDDRHVGNVDSHRYDA